MHIVVLITLALAIFGFFLAIAAWNRTIDLEERINAFEDDYVSEDDLPNILVDKDLLLDCFTKCLADHQEERYYK